LSALQALAEAEREAPPNAEFSIRELIGAGAGWSWS